MLYKFFLLGSLVLLLGCDNEASQDMNIVAEVAGEKLYASEIEALGYSVDSSFQTLNFISNWVKNQLVLKEGASLTKEELGVDIDSLVNNYRNTLLRIYYEKYIADSNMDTVISEEELRSYYNVHKNDYKLDHKIIQCRLIHVKKANDNKTLLSKLIKSTNDKDISELRNFCDEKAEFCLIPMSKWYEWNEIGIHFPSGIRLNKRDIGQSVRIDTKGQVYYFYLIDYLSFQDKAPYSYIKPHTRKAILFQRKKRVIDQKKEELYNKALQEHKINTFLEVK